MKIVKSGKHIKNPIMKGTCDECRCKIECKMSETNTLVDRDTQPGMATHYVKCPECGDPFLWVK